MNTKMIVLLIVYAAGLVPSILIVERMERWTDEHWRMRIAGRLYFGLVVVVDAAITSPVLWLLSTLGAV